MPPDPLVETQMAFSMARAIMAGVKLGIYDAIGTGTATAAEVAAACKTDSDATFFGTLDEHRASAMSTDNSNPIGPR